MKIGLNGRYLTATYSGIGQYTVNLIDSLAAIDQKNTYYIFVPWKVDYKITNKKIKIIVIDEVKRFRNDYKNRYHWEQDLLARAIKKYKIELYHSLYQTLPPKIENIPYIVTIHDDIPWRFPFQRKNKAYSWYSDNSKESCRKADIIFAVSERAKADFSLVYGLRPESIVVTYQTINKIYFQKPGNRELLKTQEKFGLNRDFILYVGGFKRHKNLRFLVKTFVNVINKYKLDLDLVIPGTIRKHSGCAKELFFDPNKLKEYTKSKNIQDRVKFIGFVDIKDLRNLYHLAKIFISLSLYEGFGLPALEAMASGLPVIVSNSSAYNEIVDGAGILVYPYGMNRVSQKINKLYNDKKLYNFYKVRSGKRLKFFNNIKIGKNIIKIYSKLLKDYNKK